MYVIYILHNTYIWVNDRNNEPRIDRHVHQRIRTPLTNHCAAQGRKMANLGGEIYIYKIVGG